MTYVPRQGPVPRKERVVFAVGLGLLVLAMVAAGVWGKHRSDERIARREAREGHPAPR